MGKTLYTFAELDIGQCFFNKITKTYGIKLSKLLAFDLERNYLYRVPKQYYDKSTIYLRSELEWW
jgi:hypothetical protein